jgi:hypothetical protein
MYKDPIVDEVRKIREEQAEKYNFDLQKIFDQAIKRQKASKHPTVSFMSDQKAIHRRIVQQKV